MINRLIWLDIGANLCDKMYSGMYNGKKNHLPDLRNVLERSVDNNVSKIILTSSNLKDCYKNIEIIKEYEKIDKFKGLLKTTVGVHPTQCKAFEREKDPQQYLDKLLAFASTHKEYICAVGEFGLDYDRLFFCDKVTQLKYFEYQFQISEKLSLPLFLHCRAAFDDFVEIMERNKSKYTYGVVHSFTGTMEEMQKFVEMGFYIGVNGCSMKTESNVEVVRNIPLDRLMLETDAPWCDIRPTHASHPYVKTEFTAKRKDKWDPNFMVKGRNEPCTMIRVLEAVANIRGDDIDELEKTVYETTTKVFPLY